MKKNSLKKISLPGNPASAAPAKDELITWYYFTPASATAKDLAGAIRSVAPDHLEVWRELNILEVVLENDSLVFQDAHEVFEDPADLAFLEENHICSLWTTDYKSSDEAAALEVYKELLTAFGGMLASDTDDFHPMLVLSEAGTLKKIR